MFNMQVEIAARGASLLVPGGTFVYSTCSIDPIENEAVVAELLRRCPYLEIEAVQVEGLTLHPGLARWPFLNEEGGQVTVEEAALLPFFEPHHLPPGERIKQGLGDEEQERRIEAQLARCRRLWHEDHDTGGFFVAKLKHRDDGEGVAQTYRSRRAVRTSEDWAPTVKQPPTPTVNSVIAADEDVMKTVSDLYGMDLSPFSVWQRGKRLNLAPPMVKQRLFDPEAPTKKGDIWPGGTFHPMRVAHVGLPAFTLKKASWRSRQEAIYAYSDRLNANVEHIDEAVFLRLLRGWAPLMEAFEQETGMKDLPSGAFLFRTAFSWGQETLAVWLGARVTLMIDVNEQNVLRRKLAIPWRDEEE